MFYGNFCCLKKRRKTKQNKKNKQTKQNKKKLSQFLKVHISEMLGVI